MLIARGASLPRGNGLQPSPANGKINYYYHHFRSNHLWLAVDWSILQEDNKVEFKEYYAILRKRGWIILLMALLTTIAAYKFSSLQAPVYRASIQVRIEPARIDWGQANAIKALLRSYQVLIKSHQTAQKVIDRAQLDMSTDTLLSHMQVSPDESNFTILITVENRDPLVAKEIAETTAAVFIANRQAWNQNQRRENQVDVSVRDYVRHVPQIRPMPKVNALAGGILGAIVGIFIVLLLEWIDADILRTPETVERDMNLSVLGTIPPYKEIQPQISQSAQIREKK